LFRNYYYYYYSVLLFFRKSNMLTFKYVLHNSDILSKDCIKDLGVFLESNVYFHQHASYLFCHTIKLLDYYFFFFFLSLDSLMMLCNSLVTSKLEYASVL
jgi:hypothetical protein